jgi:hypothetical protein
MSTTTPQDELKGKTAKQNPSTLVKLDEEGVTFRFPFFSQICYNHFIIVSREYITEYF